MKTPLAVDADRTLVTTGFLAESVMALLQRQLRYFLALPFWLLRGTARFKQGIARRILSQFGEKGFDDAGDSSFDLTVWCSAVKAVGLRSRRRFACAVVRLAQVQSVFEDRPTGLADYFKALRPQHWLKNLLVFVPLFFMRPRLYEPALFAKVAIVFVAFCCCASSGYLVNDLVDVAADRCHPTKRLRPIAAGRLRPSYVLTIIPVLIVFSFVLGLLVARPVVGVLLLYYALTLTYSVYIKRVVLLDVIVLASLHTFRIIAGATAVASWPSGWVFAFSMFLFLSLALAKRYVELAAMQRIDGDDARARSYESRDAEFLASNGAVSGYIAVLVLALYITSGPANAFYGRQEILWFLCPLLLYWVGYIWLVAHRRTMGDDPFVFALRDRTSRILIVLMVTTAFLAV